MSVNRTLNASRNIVFGVILKIYQLIMPFLLRTIMIYSLGIEYLGLNSLFVSILQVLNLAELGIGSAMVFSMYQPIVNNDDNTIQALMNLYKKYYRYIGLVILVIGIGLTPFLPNLISGDIPISMNLFTLYFLNLMSTVLSYWLFAYRGSILHAHQRVDISSKITLLTDTFKYIAQIICLIYFHNYYYYVVFNILAQITNNIITAQFAKKMYPNFNPKGNLSKIEVKKINRKIRDLFTSRLGGVIVNSSDTLIISSFLGLYALAQYQNYFFIITSIISLLAVIFNSCMSGVGNSLLIESKDKNLSDLKKFTMIITYLTGFCTVCLMCLFQTFIELWIGNELLLDFSVVICLCIYYFIYEINQLLNLYKDAAGMWHEDRFRPLITAVVNLGLNVFTVQWLGLYGVILSTVISMMFIGIPWILKNLFSVIFGKDNLTNYVKLLIYTVIITILACVISYNICDMIKIENLFLELILKGIICFMISNFIFIIAYKKLEEFKESYRLLDRVTKGILSKILEKINIKFIE